MPASERCEFGNSCLAGHLLIDGFRHTLGEEMDELPPVSSVPLLMNLLASVADLASFDTALVA